MAKGIIPLKFLNDIRGYIPKSYKTINSYVKNRNIVKYKIGKTGEKLKDRFNKGYKKEYDDIFPVQLSITKEYINLLEKILIFAFKDTPKCENEQKGGSDMVDATTYKVYIVVKYKVKPKLKKV